MILTNCAACAAPLAHDAPRCRRCLTRYCSSTCRDDHWRRGHQQICGEIHLGGNAEQYNADRKYKEAVAVAVEACAADTAGQTCFICMDGPVEEGLVRGCSCRGAAGVAHVSCLARQAQVAVERGDWQNFVRWSKCGLCEQRYHGVVYCALGWACWKTYLGLAEEDWERRLAMTALGNGLFEAEHYEDALSVREAELAMTRRIGEPGDDRVILSNLANSYQKAGRLEDALSMTRDLYAGLKFGGAEDQETLISANNYAASLRDLNRFEEARSLLRETIPVAQRVVGEDSEITLQLKLKYAQSLYKDDGSTLDDLCEAVATLEETARIARRVLGGAHPSTTVIEASLQNSRATLRARETPSPAESA